MAYYKIEISTIAKDSLDKLDKSVVKRILNFLYNRLQTTNDPKQLAKPLKGNLSGYWRYRVGSYRIICDIQDDKLLILVLVINHRKEIYKKK